MKHRNPTSFDHKIDVAMCQRSDLGDPHTGGSWVLVVQWKIGRHVWPFQFLDVENLTESSWKTLHGTWRTEEPNWIYSACHLGLPIRCFNKHGLLGNLQEIKGSRNQRMSTAIYTVIRIVPLVVFVCHWRIILYIYPPRSEKIYPNLGKFGKLLTQKCWEKGICYSSSLEGVL